MTTAMAPVERKKLIERQAELDGIDPANLMAVLTATIFPGSTRPTPEQVQAFLSVATKYGLSPFTKEIYAFPGKGGGITPIIGVDGWLTLINRQPQLDGVQYEDHLDNEGKLAAITCRIHRKDRTYPNEVTEYMSECRRATDTWTKWPSRMLRHKALIQCARQAFGLVGIYDPDEAERIAESEASNGQLIAQRTRERVEGMQQRFTAPPEATATVADEAMEYSVDPGVVDGLLIDEAPVTEEAAGEGLDSDTEDFRALVQEMFDSLPKVRQKDFIAGRTPIGRADAVELAGYQIDLEGWLAQEEK